MKKRINHPESSQPSAHVSAAVVVGGWVFVSGQGPLDIASRRVIPGTIEEETGRTIRNIEAILKEAGCSLHDVVKCNCYLGDLGDFAGFNAKYEEMFSSAVPPTRTTVASQLLNGIKVEIDAVARIPNPERTA